MSNNDSKQWLEGVNEWMRKLVPNGDLIYESTQGGGIQEILDETSRRQKAQQAILGKNHRVKTLAIISAENPMGMKASREYNDRSTEEMINSLKIGHYKWFKVKGLYNNPENSVIIYNISLEDTQFLCYKYNQESVVFVDMTSPDGEISYQYWEGNDHNSKLILKHEEHRLVNAQNDSDYYTEICRHFKFRIPFFEHYKHIHKVLDETSKEYDVDKLLDESLGDNYTGYHKYLCRAKIYGKTDGETANK